MKEIILGETVNLKSKLMLPDQFQKWFSQYTIKNIVKEDITINYLVKK